MRVLGDALEGLLEWRPDEIGLETIWPEGGTCEAIEIESVGVAEPVAGIGMVAVAATRELPSE